MFISDKINVYNENIMFSGKNCFELDQRYNISWNSLKDSIRKSSDSYVTLIKYMLISL